MSAELVHERQQMLIARPWHAAEFGSIWEITGEYPAGKGRFTACLAIVVWIGDDDGTPLFKFLHDMGRGPLGVVGPDQITRARPLLLVLRDEPGTAYFVDDQPLLGGDHRCVT